MKKIIYIVLFIPLVLSSQYYTGQKVFKSKFPPEIKDSSQDTSKKLMNYCKVIKVFRISENFDFNITNQYTDCCDLFLFDTFSKKFGGSGKKFDWNKIKSFNNKKFLLSGGIDIDSIDEIKGVKNENEFFLGIDINKDWDTFTYNPATKF